MELLLRLLGLPNGEEIPPLEIRRLCREIANNQCINAVNHIHGKKRESNREYIELARVQCLQPIAVRNLATSTTVGIFVTTARLRGNAIFVERL